MTRILKRFFCDYYYKMMDKVINILKRTFAMVAVLLVPALALSAQDENEGMIEHSDSVKVYYVLNGSKLDASYKDNAAELARFTALLDTLAADPAAQIISMAFTGSVSPEGPLYVNRRLSHERIVSLENYLKSHSMAYAEVNSRKKETITRLEDYTKAQYPGLRFASLVMEWLTPAPIAVPEPEPEPAPEPEPVVVEPAPVVVDTIPAPAPEPEAVPVSDCWNFPVWVKTNLLYDLALTPNIGIELNLGNRWSLQGQWEYAWWKSDKIHWYHRIYGGGLEVRKWFGPYDGDPMHGFHVGVYGLANTYDFDLGKLGSWVTGISALKNEEGNLSYLSYGAGVTLGWAMPISKKWNLDFGISAGYLGGQYLDYIPEDQCYVWQKTIQRNYFGITGAQVSLVYILGCRNHNK